jgi:hypothetical protein
MENDMPGIQPHTLTDEELARHVYMLIGPGKLIPSEWVAELLVRLHQKIDADYTAAETD